MYVLVAAIMLGPILFFCGLFVGLVAGAINVGRKIILALVVMMAGATAFYVGSWQEENLDKLRSTSALEFLFVPLFSISGFVVGLVIIGMLRSSMNKK